MVKNNASRGVGKYQVDRMMEAQRAIITTLADSEWREYNKIRKDSQLSSATLSKHLKRFKGIIEKKIDTESGKYPYPVFYRVKPHYVVIIKKIIQMTEIEKREITEIIGNPKKSVLDVLFQINMRSNNLILECLDMYIVLEQTYTQDDRILTELMNLILELFVWQTYKVLTTFIIESRKKVLEKKDIDAFITINTHSIPINKKTIEDFLKKSRFNETDTEEFMKLISNQ